MNKKLKLSLESIIPFLILGIAIALTIGFFIMFSYVLFWGLIIGGLLWCVFFIKNLLLRDKSSNKTPVKTKGRIIEHDNEK